MSAMAINMTKQRYDILIVGAGHNGLVAATYLAKAGKKVLVLEQRETAGGQLAADTIGDSAFDPLHAGAQLRPDIVSDLGPERRSRPRSDVRWSWYQPPFGADRTQP